MKKLFFSVLLPLMVLMSFGSTSTAQIQYKPGGVLLIGNLTEQVSYYAITAAVNGMYFKHSNGRFLQLDVSPTGAPRIAGHNNEIVFYNTMTSTFNAIQVSHVYNYSDARAKSGVRDFKSGMDVVSRLRPVSYNFTGEQRRKVPSNQYSGDNSEIGLLAQELEAVLPNLVFTDEDGKKLVDYVSLIPVLIDAVQTLQKEIDELKNNAVSK